MDFKAITLAAKRASAAYNMDAVSSEAAFSQLGDTWLGMYKDSSHQAVVSIDSSGKSWLSISGTRATDHQWMDILDDVDLNPPMTVYGGGYVAPGAYIGLDQVWEWAKQQNPDAIWNVTGHSLGAARTHFTPLFLEPEKTGDLYSFESPRFADPAYYQAQLVRLQNMVCVLNGGDLWASWPWADSRWGRSQNLHIWLHTTGYQLIHGDAWPGGINPGDHDIDLVASRLETLSLNP